MTRLFQLSTALLLLVMGCDDSSQTVQVAPRPIPASRLYENVEFFISLGSPEVLQGARLRISALENGLSIYSQSWAMTYGDDYEMTVKYSGSDEKADRYQIELVFPSETGQQKEMFPLVYKGETIVFHKDERPGGYVAGARPVPAPEKNELR